MARPFDESSAFPAASVTTLASDIAGRKSSDGSGATGHSRQDRRNARTSAAPSRNPIPRNTRSARGTPGYRLTHELADIDRGTTARHQLASLSTPRIQGANPVPQTPLAQRRLRRERSHTRERPRSWPVARDRGLSRRCAEIHTPHGRPLSTGVPLDLLPGARVQQEHLERVVGALVQPERTKRRQYRRVPPRLLRLVHDLPAERGEMIEGRVRLPPRRHTKRRVIGGGSIRQRESGATRQHPREPVPLARRPRPQRDQPAVRNFPSPVSNAANIRSRVAGSHTLK